MHYLVKSDEQHDWLQPILRTPGRFLLEHMGGVDPAKGIDGQGFKFVLGCLDAGRCWVKLLAANLRAGQSARLRRSKRGHGMPNSFCNSFTKRMSMTES